MINARVVITVFVLLAAAAMFAAETQTVVLTVSGMHCGSCAEGIEAMLKRTNGVVKADVSYELREASVAFDPAKASPAKIAAAIEKMGYKAAVKK